ncbi:protein-tyrosine phosphatase family protein (plasmid) [Halobacteriovorax sp. GFR7]|uniref:protein-tyrosine phosphatase family protein n=1 Tax=unclassified Halobacteriovorax TaxID=2639665 RepID=UPI003D95F4C2
MGNLSATKKRRLHRANRQAVKAKMDKRIEAETAFAFKQQKFMETHVAAMVRHICQNIPVVMLGWSYPKKPREGYPYLELCNHAGDVMYVYGAPYATKPDDIAGVKMAAEINLECTIDIPTRDFDVPDMETFSKGITQALEILVNKGEIFVGCMGGIGRTGLALAGICKLHDKLFHQTVRPAVDYRNHIRSKVHPHAIETKQQLDFIDSYNP